MKQLFFGSKGETVHRLTLSLNAHVLTFIGKLRRQSFTKTYVYHVHQVRKILKQDEKMPLDIFPSRQSYKNGSTLVAKPDCLLFLIKTKIEDFLFTWL